jgi:integrase
VNLTDGDHVPKKRSPGDGGLYYLPKRKLWRGVVELEPDEFTGERRQKMVHARTQRDCKNKLDAIKDQIREFGEPLDTTTRVSAWAASWLEIYAKTSLDPKPYTATKGIVKNWINPTIGRKRVSAVKPSDVMAVRKRILDAGRSPGTARQAHFIMSSMFEQARKEGLCRRNVTKDLKPPAYTPKERAPIEPEDVLRLLAAAMKRKNGSLMWFRILTGQRQGEILGATLPDLELEMDTPDVGGYYTVNWKLEYLTSAHGCGVLVEGQWPCGKKQGASCPDSFYVVPDDFDMIQVRLSAHLTRPKSQTGKRVPLIPALADLIRRDLIFMQGKPNPHGLIWRHDDGSPITPVEDGQAWRDLLHECGLIGADELAAGKTAITGHVARHSVVTTLAALGVDMQLIGQIVGHSDTKITEGYRHTNDAEKMAAMEKLGKRLLEGLPAIES